MSTPRTDAAIISASGAWTYELRDEMRKLETELNEANADRLRLREALEKCLSLGGLVENPDQVRDHVDEALDTPPPPVVSKTDADALADLLKEAYTFHVTSDWWNTAKETIKTYRTKYP